MCTKLSLLHSLFRLKAVRLELYVKLYWTVQLYMILIIKLRCLVPSLVKKRIYFLQVVRNQRCRARNVFNRIWKPIISTSWVNSPSRRYAFFTFAMMINAATSRRPGARFWCALQPLGYLTAIVHKVSILHLPTTQKQKQNSNNINWFMQTIR